MFNGNQSESYDVIIARYWWLKTTFKCQTDYSMIFCSFTPSFILRVRLLCPPSFWSTQLESGSRLFLGQHLRLSTTVITCNYCSSYSLPFFHIFLFLFCLCAQCSMWQEHLKNDATMCLNCLCLGLEARERQWAPASTSMLMTTSWAMEPNHQICLTSAIWTSSYRRHGICAAELSFISIYVHLCCSCSLVKHSWETSFDLRSSPPSEIILNTFEIVWTCPRAVHRTRYHETWDICIHFLRLISPTNER